MNSVDVVGIRRSVHAHAEPGFLEFRTAALILETLEQLGVPYRAGRQAMDLSTVAVTPSAEDYEEYSQRALDAGVDAQRVDFFRREGTAVIAVLKGSQPGPVWGLRCDIDALPITESQAENHRPAQYGFRSTTPAMHACGHDGHVAIGLSLAERLSDSDFSGEVRILFQPAEEGVRGAAPMVAAGAVEGIDRMHAIHVMGDEPLGNATAGASGLATTKWRAIFTGEPAHAAAAPETGRHALAAASQATLGLLGMTRFATADTRVNVGTFHAEGSASIIPAEARITYETRSTDNDVLADMDRRAENIVTGAAQMYGVQATTVTYGGTTNSWPDEAALDDVEAAAAPVQAITNLQRTDNAPRGSDDAHLLINAVQQQGGRGCYLFLGAQNGSAPHHNHSFDFDEAILPTAVEVLENLFRAKQRRVSPAHNSPAHVSPGHNSVAETG